MLLEVAFGHDAAIGFHQKELAGGVGEDIDASETEIEGCRDGLGELHDLLFDGGVGNGNGLSALAEVEAPISLAIFLINEAGNIVEQNHAVFVGDVAKRADASGKAEMKNRWEDFIELIERFKVLDVYAALAVIGLNNDVLVKILKALRNISASGATLDVGTAVIFCVE